MPIVRMIRKRLTSFSLQGTIYHMPYALKRTIKDSCLNSVWAATSIHDERVVENYLKETIAWVLRAQKASKCGGVPHSYTLTKGYTNPYPETTGYTIPSMLASYHYFHNESYKTAGIDMAKWLVSRQLANGAIRCNVESPTSKLKHTEVFLFDLGAILDGLTSIWKETQEDIYKSSSIRLGDYIVGTQSSDGLWEKDLYFPYLGSHQARTMWALIEAGKTFKKSSYIEVALKCLQKIKTKVNTNGFIVDCSFKHNPKKAIAFTHSIGYTIEGLFKAGIAAGSHELSRTAVDVAYKLQKIAESKKQLFFANYDSNWEPVSRYQCVTGNIQIAMVWLEIARNTRDDALASTATKFLDLICSYIIDITTNIKGVRGGVPGSFPLYGLYEPYALINWAAKFFIDASLLELEIKKRQTSML